VPQPNWVVTVGLAKETTWGTPMTPPTTFLSTDKPVFTEKATSIYDRGLRGIRSALQGMSMGAVQTTVSIPNMPFYGDDSGHLLMAMMGSDTVTGTAKNGTLASSAVGATTLTYTTVGGSAPVVGDVFKIDGGTTTAEIVTPTAVAGAGPYTLTVPATKFAHAALAPASSLLTHTLTVFNTGAPPSYTLAKYDALVATARQIAGVYFDSMQFKFTNPGALTVAATGLGKQGTNVTKGTSVYSAEQFLIPWQAVFTIGGVANARVIDYEFDIKAASDQIMGMNGTQSATAAISDQLTVTGKMTIVPDDYTEFLYYVNNTQPSVALAMDNGNTRFNLQMSKTAFIDPTVLDHSGNYTILTASFEAVSNSIDGASPGVGNAPIRAVLLNSKTGAY
jgi:tail tube protein